MLKGIPGTTRALEGFDIAVPGLTQLVVAIEKMPFKILLRVLTGLVTVVSAEVVAFRALRQQPETVKQAKLLSFGTSAAFLSVITLIVVGLLLPLFRLLNDLS
ncbi:MAG: hypothetical protein R3C49_12405 [Planctomycetaceae bacterium]